MLIGSREEHALDQEARHLTQSRCESHFATIESHFHPAEIGIIENASHAVVIENFYFQLNALRHDFRGACGMKVDGITRFFSRLDGASRGFISDLVSVNDEAAAEFLGILGKIDLVAFLDEDFAALVGTGRPCSGQIESLYL